MNKVLIALWLGSALVLAAKPGFAQCPAVGASSGCGVVITINPDLSLSFANNVFNATTNPSGVQAIDATARPASADDILVGVVNNSGFSIASLTLTGMGVVTTTNPNPGNAFAFDLDGLCSSIYAGSPPNSPPPAGCPFDSSGYAGPGTLFANIGNNLATGEVIFTGGLANGRTAYFSLEAPPTSGTAATPEPASMLLVAGGLAGLLLGRRGARA